MLERKKFGVGNLPGATSGIGWNMNYPFNTGDLLCCGQTTVNYLENNSKVPGGLPGGGGEGREGDWGHAWPREAQHRGKSRDLPRGGRDAAADWSLSSLSRWLPHDPMLPHPSFPSAAVVIL